MKTDRALEILRSLLDGNDPLTGAELASDSLFQSAEVFRALRVAEQAVQSEKRREYRQAGLPANVGQEWTDEEKKRLSDGYLAGKSIQVLGKEHGRTPRAIEGRLILLGIIRKEDRSSGSVGLLNDAPESPSREE